MSDTSTTIPLYLESKATLCDKIIAINTLIAAFELRLTEAIAGQNSVVSEYQLDDGQMKIKTAYRSIDDLIDGIHGLEVLKQRYVNRYNGRGVVLRDVRGLNR